MPPSQEPQPVSAPSDSDAPLPSIRIAATPAQIRERLDTASRRGRLAGYNANPAGGSLFSASAHGHPFDSLLLARLEGDRLIFRLQLLRRLPLIFAAILLFTIWPGVYFMDELIAQFLPGLWRPWVTYYWYLPLTVLPIPWMWRRTIARSTASAHEHARETIGTIARELGGSVE